MSGEAPPFQLAKERDSTLTSLTFFYNNFYFYLFELIPEVKPLFKRGIKLQGKMLANVIRFIVHNLNESNHATFVASLTHLARVHNQRGIIAQWYDIMGLVLIHTMRLCTGTDYFSEELKEAWIHVYSKMMAVIIPVVVRGELPIEEDQGEAVNNQQNKKLVYNYKDGAESDHSTGANKSDKVHEGDQSKTKMTQVTLKTQAGGAPSLAVGQTAHDHSTHYHTVNHSSPHVRHVHQEFSSTLQSGRDSPNNMTVSKPIQHHEPKEVESTDASTEPLPVAAGEKDSSQASPVLLFTGEKCPFTKQRSSGTSSAYHSQPGTISPVVQMTNDSPGSCSYSASSDVSPMRLSAHPLSLNPEEKVHYSNGSHLPVAHTHRFRRLEKALIIAEAMEAELNVCDRVFGFRKFDKCFIGGEAVDWMIQNKYVSDIVDAVAIGNALCRARIIANVDNSLHFSNDLSYYQFLSNHLYTNKPGENDDEIRELALTEEQKKKKMQYEPVNYAALATPIRVNSVKSAAPHSSQQPSSHTKESHGRQEEAEAVSGAIN